VVTVEARGRSWRRWLNPGSSYQSSNDPRLHFGLGSIDRIDKIQVRWPDGTQENFPGVGVNRLLTLKKKHKDQPR
jgi:hypothetical protein